MITIRRVVFSTPRFILTRPPNPKPWPESCADSSDDHARQRGTSSSWEQFHFFIARPLGPNWLQLQFGQNSFSQWLPTDTDMIRICFSLPRPANNLERCR